MTVEEMIAAVQAKLGLQVDGRAGPQTWGAIYALVCKPQLNGANPQTWLDPVDARSERAIATLAPQVQPLARALVHKAASHGVTIKIISGLRTYAEQDKLYAQGRTAPGPIVTKVRGGHSNHNFGIAFDVGVFESGSYRGESPKYRAVGVLGEELGLEWGGNWRTFVDQPHFQLRPSWAVDGSEREMLAELRRRHDQGLAYYA